MDSADPPAAVARCRTFYFGGVGWFSSPENLTWKPREGYWGFPVGQFSQSFKAPPSSVYFLKLPAVAGSANNPTSDSAGHTGDWVMRRRTLRVVM